MAGQVEPREVCIKMAMFPAWEHTTPAPRIRYIKKDKPTATSRSTSQLQHQEGLGSSPTPRRANLPQYSKNGQPALILQGVICRWQPKGVRLSVTIYKGVMSSDTQHHTTSQAAVLPANICPPRGLATAMRPMSDLLSISLPIAAADRTVLSPAWVPLHNSTYNQAVTKCRAHRARLECCIIRLCITAHPCCTRLWQK